MSGLTSPWTFHGEPMIQLLAPDGQRVTHHGFSFDLAPEHCRALYRDMALTRRLDVEATALQRQGEIGMWIPASGQEAAQVGAAHALGPADHVFPSYRQHGMGLCLGQDPLQLMGLFRGVTHGGWDGERLRFHPYTIVVGAQVPHAVGYAMGMARDGAGGSVLACFGDGASSQGDVNEAFTFAAVFDAPVVFFCENNQFAISLPATRQSTVPLYRRAAGYGFPGLQVDGNDVIACQAVVSAALRYAAEGNGPVLIEAVTYRLGPHTTSDDPERYREPGEAQGWVAKDPLLRMRAYLDRAGLLTADFLADLGQREDVLARRLREGVRALPEPSAEQIYRHVYAEPHPLVQQEQEEFRQYMAGFADEAGSTDDS